MNFEEAMLKLAELAELIRDEETSLDEAIKCYDEGMKHYELCCAILEKAQQTIETYEKPIY